MQNPLGQGLRELPGPLLLTGHTGFKGTWMTFLLEHLNVSVVGYSLLPEKDSLYDRAALTGAIPEVFADIRDYQALEQFIDLHKPSTIIHMAAQPLVLKSYENPSETFEVNVMGTVNLLDIAFKKDYVKAIIVVTTDKVYRNNNSGRAFVETDPLEGKDPYSASKVGTEAVVSAWQQIAKVSGGPKVVSVRAGNVIGGGDFAENRIIPDLIRGVISGEPVEIRNPHSTRPWQHVLDPLRGYLLALEFSLQNPEFGNFNFGPKGNGLEVGEVISLMASVFGSKLRVLEKSNLKLGEFAFENKEAKVLNLDSVKSLETLHLTPNWSQETAVLATAKWWDSVLTGTKDPLTACQDDINCLMNIKPINT